MFLPISAAYPPFVDSSEKQRREPGEQPLAHLMTAWDFFSNGRERSPDYSLPNNLALSSFLNFLVSLLFNSTQAR